MHAKTILKQTLVMQISFFKICQSSLFFTIWWSCCPWFWSIFGF